MLYVISASPFTNNFYCDILHLYNIVFPVINSVTSVNLKKTGMASRNILMNHTRCSDQLCSSLWTSRFWFFVVVVYDLIWADICLISVLGIPTGRVILLASASIQKRDITF